MRSAVTITFSPPQDREFLRIGSWNFEFGLASAGNNRLKRVCMRVLIAGGTGLAGSGPGWVQFGLGDTDVVDTITIRWPDGEISTHPDVPVDHVLTFTQGDS